MLALNNLQPSISKTTWKRGVREQKKITVGLITKASDGSFKTTEHQYSVFKNSLTIENNNKKLLDSPFFNNLCDLNYVTITPLEISDLKDGVAIMENKQRLLDNYIKALDKTFTIINLAIYFLASFFVTVPLVLLFLAKATLFELFFSAVLGISLSIGATILSKETKAKVVAKCQQKIHN